MSPEQAFVLKILTITSTTTATTIGELARVRLATLTKELPASRAIIKIGLTPGANMELRDGEMGDPMTLASGTRYLFDIVNPLDSLTLKNAGTVTLELYFGK